MSDWHLPPAVLDAYAEGRSDEPVSWSVESHLADCAQCRQQLPPLQRPVDLDAVWHGVVDEIDRPERGPIERALGGVGVPEHLARVLAATPSLSLSWLLAVGVVLTSAALAASLRHESIGIFMVLAPLVPLAGIAAAYGPGFDPAYEVAVAAPFRGMRLLLLRAVAVLAVSFLLGVLGSALMPWAGIVVLSWVLPALALSLTALALGTVLDPVRVAATLGVAWVSLTGIAMYATKDALALLHFDGQLTAAVVAVIAGIAVAMRARARVDVNHLDPTPRQGER